ncbi:MAG: penicillin acylase family protein [Myxococcales bacterium]|nr:penicillin acylase family protein [Myxococcales bacterium]
MSKTSIRLLYLAAALLLLSSCASALNWMDYRSNPQGPQTAGSLELPGLTAPVEVLRDKWAIPHILAQNELDLARAMGYVHAQDRLFSMDFLRRLTEGKLAEVVGDRPMATTSMVLGARSTRQHDIGMRILGFEHYAELFLESAPQETKDFLEAYAQGVNAYIAQHEKDLPIEFRLIGYQPELWQPKDSIALERLLGWMLSTNAKVELMWAAADQVLGTDKAALLMSTYRYPKAPRILPDYQFPAKKPSFGFDPRTLAPLEPSQLSLGAIYRYLGGLPVERTDASNNWVVAGSRSVSGKPILANDPHLPHLAPSLFHLIHISGGAIDAIGASFPGVPLIVLGHNRHLAWASTNNQGDVQDLYLHKVDPSHPERYFYQDTWEDFVVREEIVRVKEGASVRDEKINVRVSRFGPVISDVVNTDPAAELLSLRWVGMDFMDDPAAFWELEKAKTPEERLAIHQKYGKSGRGNDMAAFLGVNRGESCDDFFTAMSRYNSPRQNWICADDAGHIGYVAAGFIPVRNHGDGQRVARAWLDEGRWTAFVPFKELPQRRDPRDGYIVTANNPTFDQEKYPYPWAFNYTPGHRARRILWLLTNQPKVDAASMSRIQGDIFSEMAVDFVPLFIEAAKSDESLTDARLVLERWDKQAAADSPGAALFYVAIDELTKKVLLDEMGPDLFYPFVRTHLTKGIVLQTLIDKKSPFHDSVKSKAVETWDISYKRALSAAYAKLQQEQGPNPAAWRWGVLHTQTNAHVLGGQAALTSAVNIGPEEHDGSVDTVMASSYYYGTGEFATMEGPAYRHVVDLANPARSWIVIDSGNWGLPLTAHYRDLHEMWKRNELAPGLMDRADIEENIGGVLVLEPAALP